MENQKKNKKKRSGLPTRMGLMFRIAAGAYLMYLAYSIYTGSGNMEGAEKIAFVAAIVIFAIVGAVIIVTSLRALQRGEYEGGAADPGKDKDLTQEKKEEVSGEKRIRFGEPQTMPEKADDDDGDI